MPTAPTTEVGTTNPGAALRIPGWGAMAGVVDELETAPLLRWPSSVRKTYPAMRNDSQVEALFYATTLPIRRYRWMIDPNGARDEVVAHVSGDLGLPLKGADAGPVPRSRGRFAFGDHLRLVLEALIDGHYFFEQVAPIEDGRAHLRKLAPRAPYTIEEIATSSDGGLQFIRQTFGATFTRPPELGVDRLVAYVWDQQPGRWIGRSMLRSIYREWLLKDRLLRVDTAKHERNGLGVPVAKATTPDVAPAALAAAQEIAAAWRVGEHASAALPYGVDIDLKGVQGNLPDTLRSVQRHDEAMSRRWLGMLIQLGQTETGSRALGSEFSDLIELGRDAIASWVCDTFNDHVIEDLVDWNWEAEELCPRLTYERDPGPQPVVAPPTEPPAPAGPLGAPTIPPAPAATRRPKRNLYAAARTALTEPQPRRRELFDHEILAATDFEAMDAEWRSTLEGLLTEWEAVTAAEIGELADRVAAASSLDDLATVQVSPAGAAVLAEAMRQTARDGAAAARAEAGAQGVSAPEPDLDPVDEVLDQRAGATATLLARSISEAGGRHALTLAGGSLSNEAVAEGVRDHLEGLSTAYLEQRLGGAVTSAQNYGRSAAFREAETISDGASYYASELLDNATCPPCEEIDGHQFESLEDAEANYPTGAFVHCEGGERCRGAVVAVYEESS